MTQQQDGQKRKGFASLDPARRKEIAAMGGKKAQAIGRGHKFTSETAVVAGRKGGEARKAKLAGGSTS